MCGQWIHFYTLAKTFFLFSSSCDAGWFGEACEKECVNGEVNPQGSQNCTCDPGWVGELCDAECSLHGKINGTVCVCDLGFWGDHCEIQGCPGVGESCSGHGDCNGAIQICDCYPGWTGYADEDGYIDPVFNGCDVPDCPGSPDCNGQGECNSSYEEPRCVNCAPGWMGPACEDICDAEHGVQEPMNSGICECDSCYTGRGCDIQCNNHGICVDNVTCECEEAWRGSKCEVAGCPGNETNCNSHGECNTALQECTCNPGRIVSSLSLSPSPLTLV